MVKPLGPYSREYCTVSIFNIDFEILYAGHGVWAKKPAIAIEPRVVELDSE